MTLWRHFDRGEKICLDSSILIYYLNRHARYFTYCREVVRAIESGHLTGVISTVSEMEILVDPLAQGQRNIVAAIGALLGRLTRLQILPVDRELARHAAQLRAETRLRGLDAIVATTAIRAGCGRVLGNDREFAKRVRGVEYLMLNSLLS